MNELDTLVSFYDGRDGLWSGCNVPASLMRFEFSSLLPAAARSELVKPFSIFDWTFNYRKALESLRPDASRRPWTPLDIECVLLRDTLCTGAKTALGVRTAQLMPFFSIVVSTEISSNNFRPESKGNADQQQAVDDLASSGMSALLMGVSVRPDASRRVDSEVLELFRWISNQQTRRFLLLPPPVVQGVPGLAELLGLEAVNDNGSFLIRDNLMSQLPSAIEVLNAFKTNVAFTEGLECVACTGVACSLPRFPFCGSAERVLDLLTYSLGVSVRVDGRAGRVQMQLEGATPTVRLGLRYLGDRTLLERGNLPTAHDEWELDVRPAATTPPELGSAVLMLMADLVFRPDISNMPQDMLDAVQRLMPRGTRFKLGLHAPDDMERLRRRLSALDRHWWTCTVLTYGRRAGYSTWLQQPVPLHGQPQRFAVEERVFMQFGGVRVHVLSVFGRLAVDGDDAKEEDRVLDVCVRGPDVPEDTPRNAEKKLLTTLGAASVVSRAASLAALSLATSTACREVRFRPEEDEEKKESGVQYVPRNKYDSAELARWGWGAGDGMLEEDFEQGVRHVLYGHGQDDDDDDDSPPSPIAGQAAAAPRTHRGLSVPLQTAEEQFRAAKPMGYSPLLRTELFVGGAVRTIEASCGFPEDTETEERAHMVVRFVNDKATARLTAMPRDFQAPEEDEATAEVRRQDAPVLRLFVFAGMAAAAAGVSLNIKELVVGDEATQRHVRALLTRVLGMTVGSGPVKPAVSLMLANSRLSKATAAGSTAAFVRGHADTPQEVAENAAHARGVGNGSELPAGGVRVGEAEFANDAGAGFESVAACSSYAANKAPRATCLRRGICQGWQVATGQQDCSRLKTYRANKNQWDRMWRDVRK